MTNSQDLLANPGIHPASPYSDPRRAAGLLASLANPTGAGIDPQAFAAARQRAGLLGMAAGLLGASGASRLPVTNGAAMSQGLLGYLAAQRGLGSQALQASQIGLNQSTMQQRQLQADLLRRQLGLMGAAIQGYRDWHNGRPAGLLSAVAGGNGSPPAALAPPATASNQPVTPSGLAAGTGLLPGLVTGYTPPAAGQGTALRNLAAASAERHGVEPAFYATLINAESGFDPNAVDPVAVDGEHARGIAQFLPSTAARYGVDPGNAPQALDGGARYFADLLRQHGGDYVAAAQAYGTLPHDLSRPLTDGEKAVLAAAEAANAGRRVNTPAGVLAPRTAPPAGLLPTVAGTAAPAALPSVSSSLPPGTTPAGIQRAFQVASAFQLARLPIPADLQAVVSNPIAQAVMAASGLPANSPIRRLMMTGAAHAAGISPYLGGYRTGVPIRQYDPMTGRYSIVAQNPRLPVGAGYQNGRVSMLPGSTTAIGAAAAAPVAATNRLKYGDLVAPPAGAVPATAAQPSPAAVRAVRTARDTLIPPLTAQGPLPGGTKALDTAIPSWQKKVDEWTASLAPTQLAEQRLWSIAHAFKLIQTGAFTSNEAELAAALRAAGIDASAVLGNPAQAEIALHENYLQTLQRLKASTSRFTQREFMITSEKSEHPNLQPAANLRMLSEDIASLQRAQKLPADWIEAKKLGWRNPLAFESAWDRANPLSAEVAQVRKTIGPLKGMPGYKGPVSSAGAQIAHNPQTGQTLILKGGKWVDQATGTPYQPEPPIAH